MHYDALMDRQLLQTIKLGAIYEHIMNEAKSRVSVVGTQQSCWRCLLIFHAR